MDIDALAPGMLVATARRAVIMDSFVLGEASIHAPSPHSNSILSSGTLFLVLGFYQKGGIKHVRFLMNGKTVVADNRSLDCMEILR